MNIAEKPSVAKTLTEILSKRNFEKLDSYSQYNPVFKFHTNFNLEKNIINPNLNKKESNKNIALKPPNSDDKNSIMYFTSVLGHIMNFEFENPQKWELNKIKNLFDKKISKSVTKGSDNIIKNIDKYAK